MNKKDMLLTKRENKIIMNIGKALYEHGFNSGVFDHKLEGVHRATGTLYDKQGYDTFGFNVNGYNKEGVHVNDLVFKNGIAVRHFGESVHMLAEIVTEKPVLSPEVACAIIDTLKDGIEVVLITEKIGKRLVRWTGRTKLDPMQSLWFDWTFIKVGTKGERKSTFFNTSHFNVLDKFGSNSRLEAELDILKQLHRNWEAARNKKVELTMSIIESFNDVAKAHELYNRIETNIVPGDAQKRANRWGRACRSIGAPCFDRSFGRELRRKCLKLIG